MNAIQTTPLTTRQVRRADLPWTVCRRILGLVLLTAASLKAYELATTPLLGAGLLHQRWLLTIAIEAEAVFGGWFLLGAGNSWMWVNAQILWLVFLCVAGWEAESGTTFCGCFGKVQVDPWYTASFDLIVVLILPFCRPNRREVAIVERGFWLRWAVLALIAIAGVAFGAWNLGRYSPSRLSGDGLTLSDGIIVLEPEKWVGHPFILVNYIDVGQQLTHGEWIVLLYRYDCEHCQRAVPQYSAYAERCLRQNGPNIAFVEIPPFAPHGQELIRQFGSRIRGTLSPDHDWFISTPVAVILHDGSVQAVSEGSAAENPDLMLKNTTQVAR